MIKFTYFIIYNVKTRGFGWWLNLKGRTTILIKAKLMFLIIEDQKIYKFKIIRSFNETIETSKAYSESCQESKMELFTKIAIVDIWQVSEYASDQEKKQQINTLGTFSHVCLYYFDK